AATTAATAAILAARPFSPESQSTNAAVGASPASISSRSWLGHARAEATLRVRDEEFLRALARDSSKRAIAPGGATAMNATIPAGVQVGQVLSVRVPQLFDQCNQFMTINAVVRAVTRRSVFLEDTGNPKGGYSAADFQTLGNFFENTV